MIIFFILDTGCYGFIADYTCKKFPDPPAKVNASVAFNPENRKLDLHVHWCPPGKCCNLHTGVNFGLQ